MNVCSGLFVCVWTYFSAGVLGMTCCTKTPLLTSGRSALRRFNSANRLKGRKTTSCTERVLICCCLCWKRSDFECVCVLQLTLWWLWPYWCQKIDSSLLTSLKATRKDWPSRKPSQLLKHVNDHGELCQIFGHQRFSPASDCGSSVSLLCSLVFSVNNNWSELYWEIQKTYLLFLQVEDSNC